MVVKKNAKGEWCTYHCHGPDKGKVISCFETRKKAEQQHRSFYTKKIEINIGDLVDE